MSSAPLEDRRIQLPGRESQVLELAAKGFTDKHIALELGISQETVGTYWRRILLRFGAASRTEVVARVAEQEAQAKIESAQAENQALLEEIHARTAAQAQELAQRNMLEAITHASLGYISGNLGLSAIFDSLLESLLQLSQSEYAFIGEVHRDAEGNPYLRTHAITNIAWSPETRYFYETNVRSGLVFRNLNTLFGHVMTSGERVIANDPANDPRAGGLPHGHPDMRSFLGLPIYSGPDLVGMIGMANRPGGYDDALVSYLEPFVATCANLIVAFRTETKRLETEKKLQDSLTRLHVLMDSLSSGVLFEDENRRVAFCNEAFCRIFSIPVPPAALMGLNCADAAQAAKSLFDDPDSFLARLDELVQKNQPVVGEEVRLSSGRVLLRDFSPVEVQTEMRGFLWHYRPLE